MTQMDYTGSVGLLSYPALAVRQSVDFSEY